MTTDQAISADDAAPWTVEETDLAALRGGIARVLDGEADRLRLHDHIDRKTNLDAGLWTKAVELGWQAIGLPEDFHGLGFGPFGLDVLHRELGRKAAPGPFMATLSAAQAILDVADSDVKSQWLPRLAAGECSLAVAAQIDADPTQDGIWLLGSDTAEAALVPVNKEAWGLVPLEGAEGVDLWDRTRTVMRANLKSAKPVAALPGEATAQSLSRHLALAIASDSIGGARAMTEQTIAYMKERQQFGRSIASFQALKHRVADLMTMIVSGEEVVSLAVEAAAAEDPDADIWANLAKAHATDAFVHVCTDCTQLHGGVGFTWEFDVHLYLKRARLSEMLIAPNTKMRDRAAAQLAASVAAGRQPLELALR